MKTEGVGVGWRKEDVCTFLASILLFDLWCKGVDNRKQLLIVSEPLKHIEMIVVGYIATVLILKRDYTLAYDYN